MTIAILTATVWSLGYIIGFWMGSLNQQSKQLQRDLKEVTEGVAALGRALQIDSEVNA